MSEKSITPAVEEYLEAIHRLTASEQPVSLTSLAERLGVSVVSANEMVRKMAQRQLVTYEPYRGVALTPQGYQHAEMMLRRHRLWERFLTDVLGLAWHQVHREACRLEHATSDLVEERLAVFLEQPGTCPHGHPLSGKQLPLQGACTLAELEAGRGGRIMAVMKEDAAFLQALDQIGLRPGAIVQVQEVEPAIHSITICIEGKCGAIADAVAEQIMVVPFEDSVMGSSA